MSDAAKRMHTIIEYLIRYCYILLSIYNLYNIPILQDSRKNCERTKDPAICQYGPVKYRDDRSKCIECYCNEPCYNYECHVPGTKCSVETGVQEDGVSIKYR